MARVLPFAWGSLFFVAALLFAALLAALLGRLLGRALRDLSAPDGPKERPALIAACIILLSSYTTVSLTVGRRREARLEAIRREVLTPERVRALAAPGEDRARLEPLNPDRPAANPSTPADVAVKLALDENETVRLYASSHPSRRK